MSQCTGQSGECAGGMARSGMLDLGDLYQIRIMNRRKAVHKAPSTMLSGGIRFATVQALLDFLPDDERVLMEQLREFVISEVPYLKERLSYNVVAYKLRRDICFLWPASVLWGGSKTYEGVRFGFSHADLLTDPSDYLARGNRKQVYWRDLQEFNKSDERMLRQLLAQAVEVDQERAQGLR